MFTFINVNQSACETIMKVKVIVYKKNISKSLYLPGTFEFFSGFPGTNTLFLTGLTSDNGKSRVLYVHESVKTGFLKYFYMEVRKFR